MVCCWRTSHGLMVCRFSGAVPATMCHTMADRAAPSAPSTAAAAPPSRTALSPQCSAAWKVSVPPDPPMLGPAARGAEGPGGAKSHCPVRQAASNCT
eukprot:836266-Prorocentrum_minimum.AAC.1